MHNIVFPYICKRQWFNRNARACNLHPIFIEDHFRLRACLIVTMGNRIDDQFAPCRLGVFGHVPQKDVAKRLGKLDLLARKANALAEAGGEGRTGVCGPDDAVTVSEDAGRTGDPNDPYTGAGIPVASGRPGEEQERRIGDLPLRIIAENQPVVAKRVEERPSIGERVAEKRPRQLQIEIMERRSLSDAPLVVDSPALWSASSRPATAASAPSGTARRQMRQIELVQWTIGFRFVIAAAIVFLTGQAHDATPRGHPTIIVECESRHQIATTGE